MARKTIFTDDLEEADVEADAGTISFALEGTRYEIDLSSKNATKLRSTLAPYIAAARKVAGRPQSETKPKAKSGSGYGPDQLTAIREWARSNGFEVADKGRIRNDIILAFEQQAGKKPELFSAS